MDTPFIFILWAHATGIKKMAIVAIFPAVDDKKAAIVARSITSRLKNTPLSGFRLRRADPKGKLPKGYGFA
jgi:hypothetical protein